MPDNQSGKFRPRRVNFAQISNTALQDNNLSLKAKGLYSLIQSLITLPGEDQLLLWKIKKKCKEKEKAFDSAWKELKDAGYLKQYRIPSGKNDAFAYEYELLDEADVNMPSLINLNKKGEVIKPKSDVPQEEHSTENWHTLQNGGYANSETEPDQNLISHTPHLAPYADGTQCEAHPMPNGGGIRNTEPNNTKPNNIKSISQSEDDGQTDEIREKLKEQIEYDYFEENNPQDIMGIDAIVDCIADMLSRPVTKVSGVAQSRESLQSYINRVDSCTIKEFLEHMRSKNLSGVQNITAYWQSALINFLREQELLKLQV